MNVYVTGEDGTTRQADEFTCPVLVIDDPEASFARRCGADVAVETSGLTTSRAYLNVECEHGHTIAAGIPDVLRDMERDEDGVPLGA